MVDLSYVAMATETGRCVMFPMSHDGSDPVLLEFRSGLGWNVQLLNPGSVRFCQNHEPLKVPVIRTYYHYLPGSMKQNQTKHCPVQAFIHSKPKFCVLLGLVLVKRNGVSMVGSGAPDQTSGTFWSGDHGSVRIINHVLAVLGTLQNQKYPIMPSSDRPMV